MSKVVIGVVPMVDEEKACLMMMHGYFKGIEDMGGIPVMLPLTADKKIISQLADEFDGFLFTGGEDVEPALYNEKRIKECGTSCKARDDMERILLEEVLLRDKAVLGICRGIQLINVALGGTLYQHIPLQHPSNTVHQQATTSNRPIHKVELVENSPLYKLINEKQLAVNSYHHQAIKDLADDLSPMAYSEDGLVESVYMKTKKFVWAVQWHPERSVDLDEESRLIFERFVNEAGKR